MGEVVKFLDMIDGTYLALCDLHPSATEDGLLDPLCSTAWGLSNLALAPEARHVFYLIAVRTCDVYAVMLLRHNRVVLLHTQLDIKERLLHARALTTFLS